MSETTLTFEIGGRVEMRDLRDGIALFDRLISALTPKTGVVWVVEDLRAGSVVATLRGESNDPAVLEGVIAKCETVARDLSQNRDPEHGGAEVVKAAREVALFAYSRDYVRFMTPNWDCKVYGYDPKRDETPSESVSIGAITGRVQTLSSRSGLRFVLYDDALNKAVECYPGPGQEEMMKEAWGKRARVFGKISRDWETGIPKSARDVIEVEILEEVEIGAYRNARGAVPLEPGAPRAEEAIRRFRDA